MTAFIFVPLLAITSIFGLALASYMSHIFLTIVEETGNGIDQPLTMKRRSFQSYMNDGFRWTEDGFADWLIKLFYLGYLALVWFGPSVLFARMVAPTPLMSTVITLISFWLFFPLGVTSSLTANSRWAIFNPPVFNLMAHRPGKTVLFYLLSFPCMLVFGFSLWLLLIDVQRLRLMLGVVICPVATISFFMYCRLLGRYSYTLNCVRGQLYQEPEPEAERPKKRRPKKATTAEPDPTTQWSNPTVEHDQHPINAQPEDLPPIMTPDEGEVTGYNIDFSGRPAKQAEVSPKKTIIHQFDGEEDASPIPVNSADEANVPTAARVAQRKIIIDPPEREIALYVRKRPQEMGNPYGIDVLTQLMNANTIAVGFMMTGGLAVQMFLVRLLEELRPI